MVFHDRFHAGRVLAQHLMRFRDRPDVIVLALPRGGVPVAYDVAKALHVPLDIFLVRKLGLPGHEELAMGAIATGNVIVLNQEVVDQLHIPDYIIQEVARREQAELERQENLYRRGRPLRKIVDQTVILIDDGLATGSTMRAAVKALRQQRPREIIVAVPVGAAETCAEFRDEVDDVICAIAPEQFMAVGAWYEDFSPTDDATVERLLDEASQWEHTPVGAR